MHCEYHEGIEVITFDTWSDLAEYLRVMKLSLKLILLPK